MDTLTPTAKRPPVTTPSPVQKATILFLDDEEAILASLRNLFRREGYTLIFFRSAVEAVSYLEVQPVDAVIVDLRMPDMGGAEFLEKVGTVCPEAIRVLLSGYEDKGEVLDLLARGLAHHYILKPWDEAAFRQLVSHALEVQRDLRDQRLRKVLGRMDTLPSPPKFHVRLKSLVNSLDNPIKEIVQEIEASPALVARILRVANSVFYGPRRPISTIREAVIFIGLEYVSGLVMAIEAFNNICKNPGPECQHHVEEIWDLALHRGRIAKTIAQQWSPPIDPHLPYVTALLQDIGYVVRVCNEPQLFMKYLHLIRSGEKTKYEADALVYGITHDEVGAALLEYWNFPRDIVQTVAAHHRKTAETPLAKIVQIAEGVSVVDLTNPHDPSLDRQIVSWRQKLSTTKE